MAKKIKIINRDAAKMLHSEINEALSKVGNKYSLQIKTGSMGFTPEGFSLSVKGTVVNDSLTRPEDAPYYNGISQTFLVNEKGQQLNKDDYNRLFTSMGRTYRFVGLAPKKKRFPIIGSDVVSGSYCCFTQEVLERIKISPEFYQAAHT